MGKKILLFLLCLLLIAPCTLAVHETHGNIKLLAMLEKDGNKTGTIANLELDLKQGSGRVFLQTFPLTKVSTQVSMRFAQQVACSELDIDCSEYDFSYTINALHGLVGGPSAGAAAAVLASALLLDLKIREDSAITGTINSGGIVGSVGGIKGKIEAASENGIKLVVIPKGTRMYKEEDNETGKNSTTDLFEFGRTLNITVVEAATLQDALEYVTGHKTPKLEEQFVINEKYKQTMKDISLDLCDRTQSIHKELIMQRLNINISQPSDEEIEALNFSDKGKVTFDATEYYSSASYCFRANVGLKKLLYVYKNYTLDEIDDSCKTLESKINDFDKLIDLMNITTITDLQTYMAVKERADDARKLNKEADKEKNITSANELLAFAEERFYSALAWSKFFNGGDVAFELDNERLKKSCQSKIDEAEERYSYLTSIIPQILTGARKNIDEAYDLLEQGKYIPCLHTTTKVKSEIDVVLGLLGVEEERLDELIDLKIDIVGQTLVRSQKKGIFPIIGYSYYEYGRSLKEADKYSAMLFEEYALEFSNLDIYFPKKKKNTWKLALELINIKLVLAFVIGLFAGILIMWPRRDYKTLQTPQKRRLRGKKR